MIDHIVAVAAYGQALPLDGILLSEREDQIRADRATNVQCAYREGGLDCARKF